ncbi:pseudouridylate synthase [Ancylomarina sp. 16SWW S1-10-2]|uniref:pseudouridylate synthase n=1 Tax=Ancylomarina sp. 16SWW S1-10-2 TaxID=2499681 RepID=UPI0012ADCC1B|nr:pseudouridylate synthase [Ancylomarina sp. 16SWW S1-10-2]MRT93587.1 pseudouridylate synthase [Ancylomarina sp. 16SWW S1-10-2]
MDKRHIFNFKTDISQINIPTKLNNPFGLSISDIASVAAKEFQEFISSESQVWNHDFFIEKGKMFGILVVQKEDNTYSYLGTVSGKLRGNSICDKFVPSVFDESTDDFFINRGMKELTEISFQIKKLNNPSEINVLKEKRKQKSFALQQQLFENYQFLNFSGKEKNVLQIFENSSHGNPPSAAGECAAPKLLQYAFENSLKPIALAEFWWGNSLKNKEREHKVFYPACKNKCRPILEYMFDDSELFNEANLDFE